MILNQNPTTGESDRSSVVLGEPRTARQSSGGDKLGLREKCFENAAKSVCLTGYGLMSVERALQGHSRQLVSQAQETFAAGQLDEINLNFVSVSHAVSLPEIRRIATCG
jgi:hypothetical protein